MWTVKGVTTGYMSSYFRRMRKETPISSPDHLLLLDMAENRECLGKSIVTSHRIPCRMSHPLGRDSHLLGFLSKNRVIFFSSHFPFSIQRINYRNWREFSLERCALPSVSVSTGLSPALIFTRSLP